MIWFFLSASCSALAFALFLRARMLEIEQQKRQTLDRAMSACSPRASGFGSKRVG